jgi:hypothetical protein
MKSGWSTIWQFVAIALIGVLLGPSLAECRAEGAAAAVAKANAPAFPLQYRIVDPDNAKNAEKKPNEAKLPPLIVMFPKGQTVDAKDATGPIGRLEAFRGKSRVLPDSNDNPGLPVLMAGLRFLEKKDKDGKVEGYEVELQGEFNAVRVSASKEAMESFLADKPTVFELSSDINYGIIATHSTTKLELQRDGNKLYILSVEGDFRFREGFFSYKSPTLKTPAPEGRKYLYYGEVAELPTLRIL